MNTLLSFLAQLIDPLSIRRFSLCGEEAVFAGRSREGGKRLWRRRPGKPNFNPAVVTAPRPQQAKFTFSIETGSGELATRILTLVLDANT